MPRRLFPFLVLSATLLLATPVQAAPSEADRVAARTLLLEGRKKFDAGDAKSALEFFQKAHALMHVPTTGLDLAKAHAALGQLVEARAAVDEVTRMPVSPDEPAAFTEARQSAREALDALDGRIPSITLHVTGVPLRAVNATIDDVKIPWSELGAPHKANPGAREVVITAPGAPTWKQTVQLIEGQTAPVELQIELSPIPKSAPQPQPAGAPRSEETGWRTGVLWGSVGLAVVGVGLGTGFSMAALGKNDEFDAEKTRLVYSTLQGQRICSGMDDPRCATLVGLGAERDSYRNVAIAGYVVGGLATAGAVTLLLMQPKKPPKSDEKPAATMMVAPSLGGLIVTGTF